MWPYRKHLAKLQSIVKTEDDKAYTKSVRELLLSIGHHIDDALDANAHDSESRKNLQAQLWQIVRTNWPANQQKPDPLRIMGLYVKYRDRQKEILAKHAEAAKAAETTKIPDAPQATPVAETAA